jgi:hypothetical protein
MTKTPFKPIMIVKFVIGKTYDLCLQNFQLVSSQNNLK